MFEWIKERLKEQRTIEGIIFFISFVIGYFFLSTSIDVAATAAVSFSQAFKMLTKDK